MTFVVFPYLNSQIQSVSTWKKQQSYNAKLDWDCRCSSILNSCIVFPLSAYALLFDNDFSWTDTYTISYYGQLSMHICGGYFVSDAIVVIINRNYYPQIFDFILHHIVSITAFTLVDKNQGKTSTYFYRQDFSFYQQVSNLF